MPINVTLKNSRINLKIDEYKLDLLLILVKVN